MLFTLLIIDLWHVLRREAWSAAVAVGGLACTTGITSLLYAGVSAMTASLRAELSQAGGEVLQVQAAVGQAGCRLSDRRCPGDAAVASPAVAAHAVVAHAATRHEAMLTRLEHSLDGARQARVRHGVALLHGRGRARHVPVIGSEGALFRLQSMPVRAGRAWTDGEARSGRAVALLGRTLVDSAFGGHLPRRVRVGRLTLEAVGVVESGALSSIPVDDAVLLPAAIFPRVVAGVTGVSQLLVGSGGAPSEAGVREALHRLERHAPRIRGQLVVTTSAEQAGEVLQMEAAMRRGVLGLSVVMAVAELAAVGALMITLARAHRRSVGIARALGATRRHIALQGMFTGGAVGGLGVVGGWVFAGVGAGVLAPLLDVPPPGTAAIAAALAQGALPTLLVSVLASAVLFLRLALEPPAHLLA